LAALLFAAFDGARLADALVGALVGALAALAAFAAEARSPVEPEAATGLVADFLPADDPRTAAVGLTDFAAEAADDPGSALFRGRVAVVPVASLTTVVDFFVAILDDLSPECTPRVRCGEDRRISVEHQTTERARRVALS
jgi:hypothetical protein